MSDTFTRHQHAQGRWLALVIGGVWLYQGLVPKILMLDATEQALVGALGVTGSWQPALVYLAGIAEMVWGLIFVFGYQQRTIVLLNGLALVLLIALVAVAAPVYLTTAFNALTFNVAMLALNAQVWMLLHHKLY
ncbi:DoxX-like family protein [Salinimonas marina]|uniref:DoxX-like family protein n=1 Tax=Salinimonas marina TaxID=2785918 RepID=A0A7S9DUR0_9ALTE|nr:DoxX-like family protein [Salinimonas marina]QPG04304.1 DoxX-like family protein [Salinimonas marina]